VLDLEQTLITAPLWVPPLGSRGLSAVLLDPRLDAGRLAHLVKRPVALDAVA